MSEKIPQNNSFVIKSLHNHRGAVLNVAIFFNVCCFFSSFFLYFDLISIAIFSLLQLSTFACCCHQIDVLKTNASVSVFVCWHVKTVYTVVYFDSRNVCIGCSLLVPSVGRV